MDKQQVAIIIGKLFALFLAGPLFSAEHVFMYMTALQFTFVVGAFVLAVCLVVLGAVVFSMRQHSKRPMLLAVLCLSCSAGFLVAPDFSTVLVALLTLVAAIHFIYANRFTEPLLRAIPIAAGAWVFLTLIYLPISSVWVNLAPDQMGYFASATSAIEGIGSMMLQSIFQTLIVVPLLFMYFLAKKAYGKLFA